MALLGTAQAIHDGRPQNDRQIVTGGHACLEDVRSVNRRNGEAYQAHSTAEHRGCDGPDQQRVEQRQEKLPIQKKDRVVAEPEPVGSPGVCIEGRLSQDRPVSAGRIPTDGCALLKVMRKEGGLAEDVTREDALRPCPGEPQVTVGVMLDELSLRRHCQINAVHQPESNRKH